MIFDRLAVQQISNSANQQFSRINDEHRLIYKVDDEKITIISCRDHY